MSPRRPRWSLRVLFGGALFVLVVAAVCGRLYPGRSVWSQLELATIILSTAFFVFLALALYCGVRVDAKERLRIRWVQWNETRLEDDLSGFDLSTTFTESLAAEGIGGIVLGIVLDILVSLALAVVVSALLWLGLNLAVGLALVVLVPGFYLFARSVRVAVARGRRCRGNVWRSGWYAVGYTVLYTGWFHLILLVARQLAALRSG